MKTPSLQLLAFFAPALALAAAVPSQAAPKTEPRCEINWLRDLSSKLKDSAALSGPRFETVNGSARLSLGSDVCKPAVWKHLTVPGQGGGSGLKWKDPARQERWNKGALSDQIAVLLEVSGRYAEIDAGVVDALDKAEAILKTAADLGAVTVVAKSPVGEALKDRTGAVFSNRLGLEVTPVSSKAAPSRLKAEEFKAMLKTLAEEVPTQGSVITHRVGPQIRAFRRAVAAIGGIPPNEAAMESEKVFRSLAGRVTDLSIKKVDDADSHRDVLLEDFDYGARNLIALRVAEVDLAFHAVLHRIGATPELEFMDMDSDIPQRPAQVVELIRNLDSSKDGGQSRASGLAAEVRQRLEGVKDYSDLNALFEAKKSQKDWVDGPEGQAVAQSLARMKEGAAATKVVEGGKRIEYGAEGYKRSFAVVRDLDKPGYHEHVVDVAARHLADNALDAKAQAALAAFRGQGEPGGDLSNLTREQAELAAKKLPPLPKPGPDASTPYGQILASPEAGCGSPADLGKGTMERYASKKNAALADAAGASSRDRSVIQEEFESRKAAILAECGRKEAELRAQPADPDFNAKVAAFERDKAIETLRRDCDARVNSEGANLKKSLETKKEGELGLKKDRAALEETLDKAFSDGIRQSKNELLDSYKLEGSPRRGAAEEESGYLGKFYRVERVELYFKTAWGDEAAVEACKKKLGFSKGRESGYKDPSPDNVDSICGVHKGLVEHLKNYQGKKTVPPVAGEK